MQKFIDIKLRIIISVCALLLPLASMKGEVYEVPWGEDNNVTSFCTNGGVTYPAGTESLDPPLYFIPDDPVRGLGCIKNNALYFGDELRYVPAWFIFRVGNGGMIDIGIEHSFNDTSNPDFDPAFPDMTADVDFICWGPFHGETKEEVLENVYNGLPGTLTPQPMGYRCSTGPYSDNPIEHCVIENAKTDEWYLLLITNFNQKEGDITFRQMSGDGSISCGTIRGIAIDPDPVCEDGQLILYPQEPPKGATFKWGTPGTITLTPAQETVDTLIFENVKPGTHSGVYSLTMFVEGIEVGTYTTDTPVVVNPVYDMPAEKKTIKEGESYTFEGQVFSTNGKHKIRLTTKAGCDSVRNLELTVLKAIRLSDGESVCASELPYKYKDSTFFADGNPVQIKEVRITAEEGVPDTIVTFTLNVNYTKPEITSLTTSIDPERGICGGGEEVELQVAVTPSDVMVEWFDSNNTSLGTEKEITVTPLFAGNGNRSENTYRVVASYCLASEEKSVTVHVDRPLTGKIEGISQICRENKNEIITLNANSYNADSYRWTTENGSIELYNGPTYPIKSTPINTTTYRIEMTRGVCRKDTVFTINVVDPPKILRIDSIGYLDRRIVADENYGALPFRYGVNGQPADESAEKYGLGLGKHTFFIIDASDCRSKDTIYTISALQPIFPSFFSPNGDEVNDTWEIENLREYYPNAEVEIYDRSGQLVAKYPGSALRGWDGTFNGKEMPSTDYWYLVSEDGLDKVFVGHFTLRRR